MIAPPLSLLMALPTLSLQKYEDVTDCARRAALATGALPEYAVRSGEAAAEIDTKLRTGQEQSQGERCVCRSPVPVEKICACFREKPCLKGRRVTGTCGGGLGEGGSCTWNEVPGR